MIHFFTDPVLRAPIWGCMLMCLASSLMGVLIFLRKRSLLSETLSHATYPGACLGVALFALFFPQYEEWTFLAVLGGAFVSSLLGLKAINWLEQKGGVRTDAALCFVLAVFFGIGIVIASGMQSGLPMWHKQVQMLLFGQAATMSDIHIWTYGGLSLVIVSFLFLTYRPLQSLLFDRNFSLTNKLPVILLEKAVFWLLLLSLIVGIRSVGVVLMSGMVIAPAVAARQFTDRLKVMFVLAGFFGSMSGLLGNYFSVVADLPTGPAIVLVGTLFALLSLLFAPKRGLLFRVIRILSFRLRCLEENILKGIWKNGKVSETPSFAVKTALWQLKRGGWINPSLQLTKDGKLKALSIVRLHRLWELYLAERLGFQGDKIHRTAEEMEHIITPEMEEKLTHLLENPKHDPHKQPIPEKGL
ncbi:MAG: ABC transporter permease [Chlamydiae bacterium CG10_big_fil_rev_8_21_14_0_10_42_34]|nr:MAG: ABC transporter permease [Chlamydiae bacterium CG10_big_fil_rev_8_21_14_0_10_42_34]